MVKLFFQPKDEHIIYLQKYLLPRRSTGLSVKGGRIVDSQMNLCSCDFMALSINATCYMLYFITLHIDPAYDFTQYDGI